MGAWIETYSFDYNGKEQMSHPTWVRGLKQVMTRKILKQLMSHPTWVRGLKQDSVAALNETQGSHPTWVRGLKL